MRAGVTVATLQRALAEVEAKLQNWPAAADSQAYFARLDRMTGSFEYQVYLGDAWTDPAEVTQLTVPPASPQSQPAGPAEKVAPSGMSSRTAIGPT